MTRRSAAVVVLATAAAFWPVGVWLVARMRDGADEKWVLVALVCAVVLALQQPRGASIAPPFGLMTALVAAYGASCFTAPPLVRAFPALVDIAIVASALAFGRMLAPGLAALVLLALPLEATLQFFLGHPLRVVATEIAALVLRLVGVAVSGADTLLLYRGEAIGVDAPCSGIHMLWAALLLASLVAAARGFSVVRTTVAGLAATAAVVVGNGARVALLFIKEAGLVRLPDWTHEAIGLLVFAGMLLAVMGVLRLLEGRAETVTEAGPGVGTAAGSAVYIVACVAAALLPLVPRAAVPASTRFSGWPEEMDGSALQPLPPTTQDARFAAAFPGRVGRFTDGRRNILLRWVAGPTRQLHPSSDCFRGDGFEVHPVAARVDRRGQRWSCFDAQRGSEAARVCERIYDAAGGSWADASSWWWSAALGKAQAPYWAVTVVESR